MTWYAAHIVLSVRTASTTGPIPLWENVVAISADEPDEAFRMAEELARLECQSNNADGLTHDGLECTLVFEGVRKLIEVPTDDACSPIESGTELTYLTLEVNSEEDLAKMMERACVDVRFDDLSRFPP